MYAYSSIYIISRDNTAFGFSLLSYGGKLHLSLIADKSIIKDEKPLMEILEDTVHEIEIAYNNITHASMNSVKTPMEKGI